MPDTQLAERLSELRALALLLESVPALNSQPDRVREEIARLESIYFSTQTE